MTSLIRAKLDVKGCDSNVEVNTFQVLKSCYK